MPNDPIARWENEGGHVLSPDREPAAGSQPPGEDGDRRPGRGEAGDREVAFLSGLPAADQGWINPRLIA